MSKLTNEMSQYDLSQPRESRLNSGWHKEIYSVERWTYETIGMLQISCNLSVKNEIGRGTAEMAEPSRVHECE